jgi:hypothetical protein
MPAAFIRIAFARAWRGIARVRHKRFAPTFPDAEWIMTSLSRSQITN